MAPFGMVVRASGRRDPACSPCCSSSAFFVDAIENIFLVVPILIPPLIVLGVRPFVFVHVCLLIAVLLFPDLSTWSPLRT